MRLLLLLLPLFLSAQDYNAKAYEDFPFVEGFENLWTTYDRATAEQDNNVWARVFFYEKCSALSYFLIQAKVDVWTLGDGFRYMALGTRAFYAIENDQMLDREKNLNKYGKDGWEFVTTDSHPLNGIKYFFKRELK